MRTILAILLCVSLAGCMEAKVDTDANAEANINTQAEIQTEVETFLKAHLESLVKAQVDTKLQGIGVDVRNKIADEIEAEIRTDLQTQIDTWLSANTQNTGMFSGGAIYVVIVAIVFLVFLFGTFIYLLQYALRWKKVWHLISQTIEHHADKEEHSEHVNEIKSHFSTALELAGLKNIVDRNLEKRGMRKRK